MLADKQTEKEALIAQEFYEQQICDTKERNVHLKQDLKKQLGDQKYDELYALLRKHRRNPNC
jgi:hypothetical protein